MAFPFNIAPLNNITPFTYRDGTTFVEVLYALRDYINLTLRPEFDAEMTRIITEFQTGVSNAEAWQTTTEATHQANYAAFTTSTNAAITAFEATVNSQIAAFETTVNGQVTTTNANVAANLATMQASYNTFVATINATIGSISNRVGPENMHRVTLTGPYTLNIDPLWPTAHPIMFQLKQDATGGRVVTMGSTIAGIPYIDPAPNAVSEFELVPNGDNTWHVFQAAAKYYDNTGVYTDRGAVRTINRDIIPAAFQPTHWVRTASQGDNATFRGVVSGQFIAADRPGVDATNKGVLYGIQAVVTPTVDRSNVPFDDVVGISIVNQGTAIGTDALYFGNNRADKVANPTGKDFSNVIQVDMKSNSILRSIGTHDVGISFGGATFTTTAMRIPNAATIAWNDASGNLLHSIRMTAGATLRLYEGGIDIRSDLSVYTQQKLVLANTKPLRGIRFGTTNEFDLIVINADDSISMGNGAIKVFASGDMGIPNNKGVQALNGASTTYLELLRLTSSDNLTIYGGKAVISSTGAVTIGNVSSVPSAPASGAVLYVESGSLKVKGSSGTVTVLGPA